MTNQEILDNAPEGATHLVTVEDEIHYCKLENGVMKDKLPGIKDVWGYFQGFKDVSRFSSLADIRRIVELETMLHDVFLELSNANHAAQCDCAHPACESCKEYKRLQQYIADVQVEINQLNGDYGD